MRREELERHRHPPLAPGATIPRIAARQPTGADVLAGPHASRRFEYGSGPARYLDASGAKAIVVFLSTVVLVVAAPQPRAQQPVPSLPAPQRAAATLTAAPMLSPTNHPRVPLDASRLMFAPPSSRSQAAAAILPGMKLLDKGSEAQALAVFSQASVQQGVLGSYAIYYAGRAQQRLGKPADAIRTFRLLQQRDPVGYLREASALAEADSLEAVGEHAAALIVYERLSREHPLSLDEVLMRLGREAEAVGDETRAIEAYARVFYEFPASEVAPLAKARLDGFPRFQRLAPDTQRFKLELGRAQRLFGAKQYTLARAAFETLRSVASGDDREVVNLRVAESDYYLKKYRAALDGVEPYLNAGSRQAEALFFYAVASRALGDESTYAKTVQRIIERFPDQSWAEEAVNNLATQYLQSDEDDKADAMFRTLCERFPKGAHTERAAWKVGWRAFREGRYEETTQVFEQAAFNFPRSDFRPAWLFWAGRAHELNNEDELAQARYTLAATDYLNTYYGRLAVQRLNGRIPPPRVIADSSTTVPPPPPNDQVVRALLEIGRYDDALAELRYGLRNWGESAPIQATIAWIYRQQSMAASGREQFSLLRGSINTMRRAYPQFMASGGEYLPKEVLSIIFPMAYWDLIQKYANLNGLDPYLVAALVAQESTFVPDIQSPARAVGLMQLMPPTARQYARKLGLPYSSRLLTNPEANIRMGTAYLADKVREFGDLHLVLASYNAGERPVRRWLNERQGLPVDQFIDDIPYPETQNYVKRILGTADDYRQLYGGRKLPPPPVFADTIVSTDGSASPVSTESAAATAPAAPDPTTIAPPPLPAKPAPAKKPVASKAPAKKRTTTRR